MNEYRLIDNALFAYEKCKNSGSEWGMNYWKVVISYLTRKYKIH